ncbi:MAG: T9SS type A sorting domain-containing protein [Bacteroidia bacterium]
MKYFATLLILSSTLTILFAQNPISRRTTYQYDFGTDSYILSTEFVRNHNEAGQVVFNSFRRWYMWQDSLHVDYLFDTEITYHLDGSVASTLDRNYQEDTLQRAGYTQYDIRGNVIKDSSYYRESEAREYINVGRTSITYDEQDRIIEEQIQYWSNDQPEWQDTDYSKYVYSENGCLEQEVNGLNESQLYTRNTFTYDTDCQAPSSFRERWDLTLRKWVKYNQCITSYKVSPDSSVQISAEQTWNGDLESWFTNKEVHQVFDSQDREIKTWTFDAGGRQTRKLTSYNSQGDVEYELSSNRPKATATWIHSYEYQLLTKTALKEHYRQKIGWDTLRNAYRVYAEISQEDDQQGRLIEEIRNDSTWDKDQYNHNYTIWRYDFEDYCDGLTKTRIIKRGETGLSPQPVSRTDYSYLNKPDCGEFSDGFDMSIAPNPAHNWLILESEMLQLPEVRIQIVDHLGRIHFSDAPGERQNRYTVPISALQVGTYILLLSGPSETISRTFIKY